MILANGLIGYFFISLYKHNEFQAYVLFYAIACFLFSYRFTNGYRLKNSLSSLIKRKGDIIEISIMKPMPFVKKSAKITLDVNRISIIRISKNWLSIIIDGNGNGYDFQLVGNQRTIEEYIVTMFSEKERSHMDIKCI